MIYRACLKCPFEVLAASVEEAEARLDKHERAAHPEPKPAPKPRAE